MAQIESFRIEPRARAVAPPVACAPATSGRILLVDDEDRLRAVIRDVLERLGYLVCDAGDGEIALALVERGEAEPDLLITDLSMPGMGGLELVERLRTRWPDLKVLLMSGLLEGRLPAGPSDPHFATLGKPFQLQELAGAVRALLEA